MSEQNDCFDIVDSFCCGQNWRVYEEQTKTDLPLFQTCRGIKSKREGGWFF
jgi:hypothetical protein